jgi:hypothetical protein
MSDSPTSLLPTVGMTVREVAKRYRVSPLKVRRWLRAGLLGAINVAATQCAKAQLRVLPRHLELFEAQRAAAPAPKVARRTKRTGLRDYYPGE